MSSGTHNTGFYANVDYEVMCGIFGQRIAQLAASIFDGLRQPTPDAQRVESLELQQTGLHRIRDEVQPDDARAIARHIAHFGRIRRASKRDAPSIASSLNTTWCKLHHAAKHCLLWLCAIRSRSGDASPLKNVVRLKPAPRLAERPVCTRFGACVMSVLFQGGGAFWTNTIFPLQTGPTTARRPAPEFGNCRWRH